MMSVMDVWFGPLAAAMAAMLWAIATALFERAGRCISARVLNMTKGLIGSVLLGTTLAVLGTAPPDRMPLVVLLIVSGIIGLGLGDTAFFMALRCIGLRHVLLLQLLAPIFTGLIAAVWLDEVLPTVAWLGIAVTLGGLGWVISERGSGAAAHAGKGEWTRGVIFGLVAALSQSVGAVISRDVMVDPNVDALWAALIRLLSGALVLAPIIVIWRGSQPPRRADTKQIAEENTEMDCARPLRFFAPLRLIRNTVQRLGLGIVVAVLVATVLGTCIAVSLQQAAFKYTEAATAQTLLSLTPLFALPIAALRGERITARSVIGALIATAGVALFLFADKLIAAPGG